MTSIDLIMMKKIPFESLAHHDYGWLNTRYHFSFANYYDPKNMGYGMIRVINDDIISPGTGFEMHPHQNMEIVTYIIDGQLTHADSLGNSKAVGRGSVQYMSAGTGIYHAEHNKGTENLRLLQIWILPRKNNQKPNYGDLVITEQEHEKKNKWLHLVSSNEGDGLIKIDQDTDIMVSELSEGNTLTLDVKPGQGIYFINIEGKSLVNGVEFGHGDAGTFEEPFEITSSEYSHVMVLRTII
jgi:redox-sensitive bicupin YhaK (pirin superfamily)